jgi:ribosome-associated heat shock protein Hsp15
MDDKVRGARGLDDVERFVLVSFRVFFWQSFGETMDDTRLDKWLWSVRVFKTRAEAATVCRNGRVQVNGLDAKPGRDVHVGEVVSARVGLITRTLKVVGVPRSRVAAKQLPEFIVDLTPAAEYERAKQANLEHLLARERGRGRPTKKDRRQMGELFGFE